MGNQDLGIGLGTLQPSRQGQRNYFFRRLVRAIRIAPSIASTIFDPIAPPLLPAVPPREGGLDLLSGQCPYYGYEGGEGGAVPVLIGYPYAAG